jgi:membrane protease YdiL (CAAX protease family)
MKPSYIFINEAKRLRSGWRLIIFIAIALVIGNLLFGVTRFAFTRALGIATSDAILKSNWGHLLQASMIFVVALLAGWACGAALEGLPLRALGWATHPGWLRDLLMGSLVGIASLLVATALATATGGFRFAFNSSQSLPVIGRTLVVSLFFFIIAAASEEVLFRGYPLQTMTRAHLAWVAIVITAALFASAHLDNPNVVPGFTFINTALAGVWLAVAYLRTRSLWFPLGIHWSWNWMMGAVLGLPVSGIERLTPSPLLRATDAGPAWLTGGAYGIEGGAACTVALLLSTVFIWRTRLIKASAEMKALTDHENPKEQPLATYQPLPDSNQPPASNQS